MLTWFRKNMKGIMIAVAVIFIASIVYLPISSGGFQGKQGGANNQLAKVNGQEISPIRYRELMSRLVRNFGGIVSPQDLAFVENLTLGQSIDFTLMLNEAKRKVKVSGGEIDAAIDSIMRQQKIPSKRILEENLKRVGLNYGQFRELIKEDILVQKLAMKLREEVKVTPDDLREIRCRHILVTNEVIAQIVMEQIKKGGDFAALAKKYSQDPGTANRGGDLGFFDYNTMVAPFAKAAFALKIGQVSEIVKSPFGYHIIKLEDSRIRKFPGNVKDIQKAVLQDKQEKAFRNWYGEVRSKAKVEIISHELLGNDFRFKGKLVEAAEEYKKAIVDNPGNPFLHVFLGDTYMAGKQAALAISEYEMSLKIDGSNPELYIILGKAYEATGRADLADEQYKRASLVAGDNKFMHQRLQAVFSAMKKGRYAANEVQEIKRIEGKEKLFQQ